MINPGERGDMYVIGTEEEEGKPSKALKKKPIIHTSVSVHFDPRSAPNTSSSNLLTVLVVGRTF